MRPSNMLLKHGNQRLSEEGLKVEENLKELEENEYTGKDNNSDKERGKTVRIKD